MKMNSIRAMSPKRFLECLDKLELTQRGAGRFFGINERTVRHMADGQSLIDPRTAMLLEIMVKHKITPEAALKLIGVDVKAAIKQAKEEHPLAAPVYFGSR
jgi:hypothetical protein